MKNAMNIVIVILSLLCLLLVILVDLFTFELKPDKGISGNGNPGVIFFVLFILLYAALIMSIYMKFLKASGRRYAYAFAGFGGAGTILFSILLIKYVVSQYEEFAGRLEGFGVLNQYTNTVFVNFYSFVLGLSVVFTTIGLVHIVRRRIKKSTR
ncbi:hypothetical protein J40TS1_02940 [Paenibacillus montaniterrae]|uniref:Uncharacterized protein n=1 Tax=Paenibacillus montaniterrae TaxID=429341 RepID=A0A919YJV3_9BACL|nr:hypothetical protein [Paenibacillus montaniterrae]GIP14652.1 hypothetical protein J40TS1_02940 [Paenibacillus montaniterrae]